MRGHGGVYALLNTFYMTEKYDAMFIYVRVQYGHLEPEPYLELILYSRLQLDQSWTLKMSSGEDRKKTACIFCDKMNCNGVPT